jgi:N-acetylmuramoyl-L-alanine amidase
MYRCSYKLKAQRMLLTGVVLLLLLGPCTAAAQSARLDYYKAERTYLNLKKHAARQKYRDQWMRCIDRFMAVCNADPNGDWAAASLYQAANLYIELSKRSFLEADRRQAVDLFERIMRDYPGSRYKSKAGVARALLLHNDETLEANAAPDRQVKAVKPVPADAGDPVNQVIANTGKPADATADITQASAAPAPVVVEGLRYWSNPRYTRVVIDASQDTIFTYNELRGDPSTGKPQRIYIDVHNSRLSRNLQHVISINDNLLRDARAGQYSADTVRVVVDIKSFNTYQIFSLKNPYRIVLDVRGDEPPETVATSFPSPAPPGGHAKLPPGAIVKQLALGVRRIVIDPGHGGKDYGAPGFLKGVYEKNIVLQIGKRLAKEIRDQLHCEVIMTRSTDTYLSLEERTAIANTKDADLFISIHTNASKDHRAKGIESFILNLATDDEAVLVAARENATSTKNISDLDSILHDLMRHAKVSESTRLGGDVQNSIMTQLQKKYHQVNNKGIKQAPFYVLLGADMPSILIETSFISNPTECRRLLSKDYQEKLCQGIVEGIKHYIQEIRPLARQ